MFKFKRNTRSERGAVAVFFALVTVALLAFAALGVDIAQQVSRKHLLISQLDSASTAAAYNLGDTGSLKDAVDSATAFFAQNGQGTLSPSDISFWCVVARKLNSDNTPADPAQVAQYQIPSGTQAVGTCNPDAISSTTTWKQSDYQNRTRSFDSKKFNMSCNSRLCAVPCGLAAGPSNNWAPGKSLYNNRTITCNTIRVGVEQDVPFDFAPVIGINKGSTGAQVSVACAGSCGEVAPNPMDVVLVADRTLSMKAYRGDLRDGIKGMLQVMTPEQQYVSFGAIGPSIRTRSTSELSGACDSSDQRLIYASKYPSTSTYGSWIPIPFKKDYLSDPDANGVRSVNSSSNLVKAINCLASTDGDGNLGQTGTELAAPLKAAARYLLGWTPDGNNISALGGSSRSGHIRKVIIFETDGNPQEPATTTTGTITLENDNEVFSNYTDSSDSNSSSGPTLGSVQNGKPPYGRDRDYPDSYQYEYSCGSYQRPRTCTEDYSITSKYRISLTSTSRDTTFYGGQQACKNFLEVARQAKAQGILIITIGYGLGGNLCSGSNSYSGSTSSTDTDNSSPWVSDIQPTSCRKSGNGSQNNPYRLDTDCRKNVTITYTQPQETTTRTYGQRSDDQLVTDVLAQASGGDDKPAGTSNGCSSDDDIAAENSDDDLFFCVAKGADLAPLFVSALGSVTGGVKLMNLPGA